MSTLKSTAAATLLLSALFALACPAAPPVVSNITASQRAGTKFVDVSYDLADLDTATLTVSLQISPDGGATWTVPATSTTGAIGSGVAPGLRHTLAWNAGADWNGQYSMAMRFRVTAEDGTNVAPPGFALIPAGIFTMGNSTDFSEGNSDETVHTVSVSAFYLQTTLVTKAQWDGGYTYALANGYSFDNPGAGKEANHPVQSVSWSDVVKWCNARSQQDGLAPCYTVGGDTYKTGQSAPVCDFTKNGFRLPTESEWEKAARGGLSGKRFPSGDTITHAQANYYSDSTYAYDTSPTRGYHPTYNDGVFPYTSPVTAFAPNGYGLYDMAGNVWQWCWDWYGTYPGGTAVDPTGASSGSNRVLRGVSWYDDAYFTRVAYRYDLIPDYGNHDLGFRPARGRL